jgi:hypothetical protein
MRTTFKYIVSIFVFSAVLVTPAFAQWAPKLLHNPAPGAGATMQDFVGLLIEIVQAVGIPILAVCLIYAGFLMVTASGNEAQVTKAKLWIFWTLVGALIILGAAAIANMVYGTATLFS